MAGSLQIEHRAEWLVLKTRVVTEHKPRTHARFLVFRPKSAIGYMDSPDSFLPDEALKDAE
jgi:hypothetical protein